MRARQPLLHAHPRLSSVAANCLGMMIEEHVAEPAVEMNSPMRLTAALPSTDRPMWEDAVGLCELMGDGQGLFHKRRL